MIARGNLIGALSFGGVSGPFSPEQIDIAQEVATQFAIALMQARLFEHVKRQTQELEDHNQTLTTLIDASPLAIVLVDAEDRVNSSNTYGFIAEVMAVEVDPQTAAIRILRYVTVHDAGTIINPMIAEGQIYGGALHGLGGALYEELQYDEDGQCLTGSFMDYLVPTASEAPTIEIAHVVSPSPLTPLGSKGLGESSSMTVPAVIANAVSDALSPLGIRINELPMTPSKLWKMIDRAGRGHAPLQ